MLCKSLHHAAFRCKDARQTVDFYTQALGLKFIHAMGEDHVPSTGAYSPHIHVFLEMEDGSCIAFFELPHDKGEPSGRDAETPGWAQHFAFRVKDGEDVATKVCAETQLWILGESLGGVESLIEHPGLMTHASVTGTELEVPSDLIRLSVGIEDVEDLVADLGQALDRLT